MNDHRDAVVEAVREDLLRRSQFGIAKYGVSLERTDLSLRDWLQHAYEECLDAANYLKRTIVEIDGRKAPRAIPPAAKPDGWGDPEALARFNERWDRDGADAMSEDAWGRWVDDLPPDEFMAMLSMGADNGQG